MARHDGHPLALRIMFLGKHIGYLLERRLANQGLNRTQTMILLALDRHPGLKALELCAPARVEPANVTRTLQSLERLGLLERLAHPTDGRASIFYLTAEGQSTARELGHAVTRLSAELLQGMSPEELSHLEEALGRVRDNLHRTSDFANEHAPAGCRPQGQDEGSMEPEEEAKGGSAAGSRAFPFEAEL